MFAALALLGLLQVLPGRGGSGPAAIPASTKATAALAVRPPVIDGRDDDDVWRQAIVISGFREFDPVTDKEPRFRTEARVAFDARHLYVFVRMFDPEPSRILKLLARRDTRTGSDQIKIIVDSYHDRRSGYEFAVNPAGVKRDFSIANDSHEDAAWDGIWDAATRVDSLGWTAEFRIPLSQLRFGSADVHTFGFGIWRDIDRYKERVGWPLYRRNDAGLASQLGEIDGLVGLSSPRRLEVSPYAVTKNVTLPQGAGYAHPQRLTGGVDFKYGVSSNLTLDGTVNPDFGQVEADPAVLNLSAFETFFQERRPFFTEGSGLLSFPVNCFAVRDCGQENLFYSRRIGRSPSLRDDYGDASSPTGTTILGAAKLTGRTPGGLSLGVIDAVTGREEGTLGRTIEPRSNYTVVRATQDFRHGESGLGFIGTMVNRSPDQWTAGQLRTGALVGGLDFRHRFWRSRYEFGARVVESRVTGDAAAIAATQLNAVHYFQRPDGPLRFDPARTSLGGNSQEFTFDKVGGSRLRFQTSYQRVSAGFEANDLGYIRRADWQSQATWAQLAFQRPTRLFRQMFWNMNQLQEWTAAGLPLDRMFNTNIHASLRNNMWIHLGGTWGGLGDVFCDRCARGGPAMRTGQYLAPWMGIEGDSRHAVVPYFFANYFRADGGRTRNLNLSPTVEFRISSRWTSSIGAGYNWNRDDRQWYGNYEDPAGATHYTFAHLEQQTAYLTARLNYTASPTLSLQIYAQPFVSKGQYSNIRDLTAPRAAAFDDRFIPYADPAVAGNPAEFNVKQFRSNVVARWEYRPGSALFVVWQQGRQDNETAYGGRTFGGDLRQLFQAHADNTLLVKLSYWLDR